MKYFFQTLPKNIVDSFKGKNFLWHLLAWAATAIIVLSGFDWYYFTYVFGSPLNTFLFPAVIIGAALPIFGLPLMIFWSWLRKDTPKKILFWALGQAALIGDIIASFYKAFTGRIPPPHSLAIDISHQFNFGFLKNGIFWGWPSSHTAVAFAMAFALITLYPKNKLIRVFSIIYALYIGIGVSFEIHWFSEFIAGAIIGAVVGIVVGKSFRQKIEEKI